MPIMFDLDVVDGEVVLGTGTRKACDAAIKEGQRIPHSLILLTATVPFKEEYVAGGPMGKIAQSYIDIRTDTPTAFYEASEFRTLGEAVALTRYIREWNTWHSADGQIERVIITVKWWHLPRTAMIFRRVFRHLQIPCSIELKPHWLSAGLKDLIHEIAGFPVTWQQITDRFRKGEIA